MTIYDARTMFQASAHGRRYWMVGFCVIVFVCLLLGQSASGARRHALVGVCPPPSAVSGSVSQPSLGPISQDFVVACVGSQTITKATFQHWNAIAMLEASGHSDSKPDARAAHKRLVEVMGFLVSADWLIGEARDLGVHITRYEVHREFNRLYKQQFHTRREFQVFLEQTKQTVRDLLLRVELELLSQRVQSRVVAGHHGALSLARALNEFDSKFRRKWTSQTYCAPHYAVQDCGHVQVI